MNPSTFTSVVNGYLPEPHASLLNGILFGIPIYGQSDFYHKLKIVGLLHIVVLSGMNITLLATIIGALTAFLPKKISIGITIVCLVLFILFVGAEPPIVRAGIMGILTLVAIVYGKRSIAFYSLFLSFIAILIIKPEWVTTLSLQLSYGATLGLIFFGKAKPGAHPIRREFRTSLAAQVFTAPLILYHFNQISFISPVANVLVAFLIGPLMVLGFMTVLLGKLHFLLGLLPSFICFGMLQYIIFVVRTLSALPLASYAW